jgi:hypothetical protein
VLPQKAEEYDVLFGFMFKNLESSDVALRRATAEFTSSVILTAISPPIEMKSLFKKSSKLSKDAVETSNAPTLEVETAFGVLSQLLLKATTREIRSAIYLSYLNCFERMDLDLLTASFCTLTSNLLILSSNPKLNITLHETLSLRESCVFLLHQISKRLSESSQIEAVEILIETFLKKELSFPESSDIGSESNYFSLTCTLMQLGNIISDLSAAGAALKSILLEPLFSLVSHPSESVIISLSWTMKIVCIYHPSVLVLFMEKLTFMMQRDLPLLSSEKSDVLRRLYFVFNDIYG